MKTTKKTITVNGVDTNCPSCRVAPRKEHKHYCKGGNHIALEVPTNQTFEIRRDMLGDKALKVYYVDFLQDVCDRCGITKEEAKKHPVDTGINHYAYRYSTSFSLGDQGQVHCAACHKEMALENLFCIMDYMDTRKPKV